MSSEQACPDYHAEAGRDGEFWLIRVPEIARTTQARDLPEVEAMARDLIAIMDDIPADSFDLHVTLSLPAAEFTHEKDG